MYVYSMDFSTFKSILFGTRSSSSSLQTPTSTEAEPGLRYLTVPPHQNSSAIMIRRVDLLSSSSLSFSSSSKDETEDQSEVEEEKEEGFKRIRRIRNQRSGVRREFPPPIPYLARTENLPGHMPWVLKRSYKKDGRLVIKEVTNKRHEYFKVHRANGRLTMKLMHMDTDQLPFRRNTCDDDDNPSEEEEEEGGVEKGPEEKQESQLSSSPCRPNGLRMSSSPSSVPPTPILSNDDDDLIVKGKEEEAGVVFEEQKQHEVLSTEMRKSLILPLAMPDGRVGCIPNNNRKSALLGIPIPTGRPILIGRID